MSYRILVSGSKVIDLTIERAVFEEIEATVEETDAKEPDELEKRVPGVDALVVDANTHVSERVLESADSLAVVGRSGIGVDKIDVEAAVERGITVVNVPRYCVDEVATHALALLFSCVRKIPAFNRGVRAGSWDWSHGAPIHRVPGSTLGLVAFGKIARSLARKLSGFNLDIVSYDPYVTEEAMSELGVKKVSFEDLLARSDYVSVHTPLTDDTEQMFDQESFQSMRDGAVFINTSRGGVVDEDALATALREGPVAAAGLDVRQSEPPTDSKFEDLDEVVLTPHVGWYSEEAQRELNRTLAQDIVRVLTGEDPRNPVSSGDSW